MLLLGVSLILVSIASSVPEELDLSEIRARFERFIHTPQGPRFHWAGKNHSIVYKRQGWTALASSTVVHDDPGSNRGFLTYFKRPFGNFVAVTETMDYVRARDLNYVAQDNFSSSNPKNGFYNAKDCSQVFGLDKMACENGAYCHTRDLDTKQPDYTCNYLADMLKEDVVDESTTWDTLFGLGTDGLSIVLKIVLLAIALVSAYVVVISGIYTVLAVLMTFVPFLFPFL